MCAGSNRTRTKRHLIKIIVRPQPFVYVWGGGASNFFEAEPNRGVWTSAITRGSTALCAAGLGFGRREGERESLRTPLDIGSHSALGDDVYSSKLGAVSGDQ